MEMQGQSRPQQSGPADQPRPDAGASDPVPQSGETGGAAAELRTGHALLQEQAQNPGTAYEVRSLPQRQGFSIEQDSRNTAGFLNIKPCLRQVLFVWYAIVHFLLIPIPPAIAHMVQQHANKPIMMMVQLLQWAIGLLSGHIKYPAAWTFEHGYRSSPEKADERYLRAPNKQGFVKAIGCPVDATEYDLSKRLTSFMDEFPVVLHACFLFEERVQHYPHLLELFYHEQGDDLAAPFVMQNLILNPYSPHEPAMRMQARPPELQALAYMSGSLLQSVRDTTSPAGPMDPQKAEAFRASCDACKRRLDIQVAGLGSSASENQLRGEVGSVKECLVSVRQYLLAQGLPQDHAYQQQLHAQAAYAQQMQVYWQMQAAQAQHGHDQHNQQLHQQQQQPEASVMEVTSTPGSASASLQGYAHSSGTEGSGKVFKPPKEQWPNQATPFTTDPPPEWLYTQLYKQLSPPNQEQVRVKYQFQQKCGIHYGARNEHSNGRCDCQLEYRDPAAAAARTKKGSKSPPPAGVHKPMFKSNLGRGEKKAAGLIAQGVKEMMADRPSVGQRD